MDRLKCDILVVCCITIPNHSYVSETCEDDIGSGNLFALARALDMPRRLGFVFMAEDMAYAIWTLRTVVVIFLLVPCIGALASVTQKQNWFDDQL